MDLTLSAEAVSFRDEVARFLEENWRPKEALGGEGAAYVKQFRRTATEAGYLNRSVPRRFGGSEQAPDMVKADLIRTAFRAAGAPMEVPGNGMALLVPTLLEWGAEWQKAKFVPSTVAGDFKWAQGYSEPSAGSDLASLRTRAELVDGRWRIFGQKIWTTLALTADYIFMLVRTEPDKPRHEGISYLLVELRQPGIEVRPIKQITGEQNFCEVFFDGAETPAEWIVGARGQGWAVSRSTLKAERNSLLGSALRTKPIFDRLTAFARHATFDGGPALQSPAILDRLGEIERNIIAQRGLNLPQVSN
jgi:alkylation response protein AidB-like acyl-CoA dehydrogenase